MIKKTNWLAIVVSVVIALGILLAGHSPADAGVEKEIVHRTVYNTVTTDTYEAHRVVRGYSERAIAPNFFDNDWTYWRNQDLDPKQILSSDGTAKFNNLTLEEQDYLKSLLGLQAKT